MGKVDLKSIYIEVETPQEYLKCPPPNCSPAILYDAKKKSYFLLFDDEYENQINVLNNILTRLTPPMRLIPLTEFELRYRGPKGAILAKELMKRGFPVELEGEIVKTNFLRDQKEHIFEAIASADVLTDEVHYIMTSIETMVLKALKGEDYLQDFNQLVLSVG